MTAFVLDLGSQPAEDILSLSLADANVQPIAERLDILDIPIVVCPVTEQTDRRTAQFQDAPIQAHPQIGRRVLGNDLSIPHETNPVTA